MDIGMTISRSSAMLINELLIFDMHDIKGVLFLKVSFSCLVLGLISHVTVIFPFTTIYASNLILAEEF